MFVANYPESSLYVLEFDKTGLRYTQLNVDRDWMLLIAFFRNKLTDYAEHPVILNLRSKLEGVDYIVAPIADNRMFEIIDSFIDGEITGYTRSSTAFRQPALEISMCLLRIMR